MTVAELIAELSKLPPEADVAIFDHTGEPDFWIVIQELRDHANAYVLA